MGRSRPLTRLKCATSAGERLGPSAAAASPPGISLPSRKTMKMTPRITMMAWMMRLIRKPIMTQAFEGTENPPGRAYGSANRGDSSVHYLRLRVPMRRSESDRLPLLPPPVLGRNARERILWGHARQVLVVLGECVGLIGLEDHG